MRSDIFSARRKKTGINRMPRILIYESEAMRIARYTQSSARIEIGGDFFGFYEPGGSPLVFVASGPGPAARRDVTHFQQDTHYQTKVFNQLASQFRMFYLGDWHSHHNLGLSEPSGSDDAKLEDLANKNGWPQLFSLIVQTDGGRGRFALDNYNDLSSSPTVRSGPVEAFGIWWNAFHYTFSNPGMSRQRVTIDFQSGESPYRSTADEINSGSILQEAHNFESTSRYQAGGPEAATRSATVTSLEEFIVGLYQMACGSLSDELRGAEMEVDLQPADGPRLVITDKGRQVVCRVVGRNPASLEIAVTSLAKDEVVLKVSRARGVIKPGDVKMIVRCIVDQFATHTGRDDVQINKPR